MSRKSRWRGHKQSSPPDIFVIYCIAFQRKFFVFGNNFKVKPSENHFCWRYRVWTYLCLHLPQPWEGVWVKRVGPSCKTIHLPTMFHILLTSRLIVRPTKQPTKKAPTKNRATNQNKCPSCKTIHLPRMSQIQSTNRPTDQPNKHPTKQPSKTHKEKNRTTNQNKCFLCTSVMSVPSSWLEL